MGKLLPSQKDEPRITSGKVSGALGQVDIEF
jgi:hypothetical protein